MVHLACSLPNLGYAIDSHYHDQADDIITKPWVYRDGAFELPTGPGLGVELDLDKVDFYHRYFLENQEVNEFYDPNRPGWVPALPIFCRGPLVPGCGIGDACHAERPLLPAGRPVARAAAARRGAGRGAAAGPADTPGGQPAHRPGQGARRGDPGARLPRLSSLGDGPVTLSPPLGRGRLARGAGCRCRGSTRRPAPDAPARRRRDPGATAVRASRSRRSTRTCTIRTAHPASRRVVARSGRCCAGSTASRRRTSSSSPATSMPCPRSRPSTCCATRDSGSPTR